MIFTIQGFQTTVFIFTVIFAMFQHCEYNNKDGGARGVMVIVAGCGHDDTSSNPGRA